jgi:hypothetical protein
VPFKWKVTPRQSLKAMTDKYTKALFAAGNREAEQIAQEMEVWARANAPWMDRTGDARALLDAHVDETVGPIGMVVIQHGVPYGLWLEIANQGRYAIIAPTIDMWAPIFFHRLERLSRIQPVTLGEITPPE